MWLAQVKKICKNRRFVRRRGGDPALLRPGRIDPVLGVGNMMRIHSRKMNLLRVIDLVAIAEKTINKAVCTEADMLALRQRVHATQEDFEVAVSKVMKKDTDANTSLQRLWK